jgi:GTP-dependent phosphoenolpyruvate carboxykinase
MGMLNGAKHWLQYNSNVNGGCKRLIGAMQNELAKLNPRLRGFVEEKVRVCQPDQLHICDGSEREYQQLVRLMQAQGALVSLPKLANWLVV